MSADRVTARSLRILCALVLVALLLDFLFFTGFYASDDYGYLMGARAAAGDAEFISSTGTARLGITLPAAFLYWLTGGSIAAIAWFHVGYHLVLVVLTFVAGRLAHDDRTGLVAAALVAMNPIIYVFAGAVLPDNATACWVLASMTLVLYIQRRVPPGEGIRAFDRRRLLLHLVAGALLGVGWMYKETALIMTVPAAVLIMSAASLRNLAWIQNGAVFAVGFFGMLVADAMLLKLLTGHVTMRHEFVTHPHTGAALIEAMKYEGATPFARFSLAKELLLGVAPLSVWFLFVGSLAYAFLRRRNLGVMAFFWWPLIFLTIGTVSLRAYTPLPIQARYYAVAIAPAALMTAYALTTVTAWWHESGRKLHRFAPALLVLVIACVGVREFQKVSPLAGNIYRAGQARALVAALELAQERYPKQRIVLSPYLWNRMQPLVFRIPYVHPPTALWWMPPPFLYMELGQVVDRTMVSSLELPSRTATRVHDVLPSRGRLAVLADSARRMFTVTRPPRLTTGEIKQKVSIIAITPRELGAPASP